MNVPIGPGQITHPYDVLSQAAKIGAGSAVPGLVIGATWGTLRSRNPVLFSLASGTQWFTIGTTFWAIRSTILSQPQLRNWYNTTRGLAVQPVTEQLTPQDRLRASAIAGALTGAPAALLLRGPSKILQGTLLFSLVAWGGQKTYNWLDASHSAMVQKLVEIEEGKREPDPSLMERFLRSKWSPVKRLSDQEHKMMLRETVLRMQAEAASLDEQIAKLKKDAAEWEANATKEQLMEREAQRAKAREALEARIAQETPEEREARKKADEMRKRFYP